MKLSERLELVVSMVEPAERAADIGTDHGYVPMELIRRNKASSALAMDVKKGPLSRAEAHIRNAGLADRISVRLSDGLLGLHPGEADTVVIAGMGGELMVQILERGSHMWDSVSQWVLSPQSELMKFREWLLLNGFFIRREAMVHEDGKYYTVLDVRRRQEGDPEPDMSRPGLIYGSFLIHAGDPVLLSYLRDEEKKLSVLYASLKEAAGESERARTGMEEAERKLMENREVQHEMQRDH